MSTNIKGLEVSDRFDTYGYMTIYQDTLGRVSKIVISKEQALQLIEHFKECADKHVELIHEGF